MEMMNKGTIGIKWTEPEVKRRGPARCAVLIPVYKAVEKLSLFEEKSIARTIEILGRKYEIMLVCPHSMDCGTYSEKFGYDFSYIKCSNDFFKSQKAYSELCECYEFYGSLIDYEYILICQPDAWVFEDNLERFLDLEYDYIGSIHMLRANGNGGRVGNGGFSLRKTQKFFEVCKKTDFTKFKYTLLEDCVFSIRLKHEFNIATPEIGFEFGWQEQPQAAYAKTGKLPMGCHNPMKNNWNFWRNYIKIADEEFDIAKAQAIVGEMKFSVRPKYTRSVIEKKPKSRIRFY